MGRHKKGCECEHCKTGSWGDPGLRTIIKARLHCESANYARTAMVLETAEAIYNQEKISIFEEFVR